jgi:hypothetical protein
MDSKKLVISEWYELELDDHLIQESALDPSKPLIIKDRLLQKANVKNHNGRIYPKEVLFREVKKYNQLVKERRALGELDHPDSPVVELKNVSHIITDIYVKDDEVRGSIEILNTPKGKILKDIIQQKIKIGISSRGLGSLQNESGTNIVQDDFELIAFDAVSSPSTPGAFLVESFNREIDRYNNLRNILHGILGDDYFSEGRK